MKNAFSFYKILAAAIFVQVAFFAHASENSTGGGNT